MMERDARLYVSGHRGLVGSAIVRHLQATGYEQIITREHSALDLTDQEATRAFFERERPQYVFLAAAKVGGILANSTRPAEFIRDNLAIQTNVIHAAWRAGVRRLLFLGSSCIYPRDCAQPIREEYLLSGPLEATNRPYALAKIAGIEMCRSYNRQYGTCFVCAMPTNLYGPGDRYDLQSSHVLPALIRKFFLAKLAMHGDRGAIARDVLAHGPLPADVSASLEAGGREVVLWGTGQPRREFLYSDDMAKACVLLMSLGDSAMQRLLGTVQPEQSSSAALINIGWGEDLTIRQLAEEVSEVLGYEGDVRWDTSKPDGTPRKLLDVSRMKSLGWSPSTRLSHGIARALEDYVARTGVRP